MPAKTKFEIKLGPATREAFGRALVELGRENKDVVVCDADLSHSTMTTYFAKEFPDRFISLGIAEANMGTNKELVLPFLQAMIDAGVPAHNITVLEQYGSFLAGTRVNAQNVPAGVNVTVHNNKDATMDDLLINGTGVTTKFVRALTSPMNTASGSAPKSVSSESRASRGTNARFTTPGSSRRPGVM